MYQIHSRMTTTIWAAFLLAAGFALWHILPESIRSEVSPTAHAATFTVNTADDHNDGVCNAADCTLREAINSANAGDTISFNIPGSGVRTINATNGFSIAKAVTIDGTTQPSFAGSPLIEINGAGAGSSVNGLNIQAQSVTVKGLIINRFSDYGINFDSLGGGTVQGCYIGTNAAGTAASANGGGIRINANGITIGGMTSAARNVISGNTESGVSVSGGSGTSILGNFIGLNAAGTLDIGNNAGVSISGGSATVGGTDPGSRNVISGNGAKFVFDVKPAQSIESGGGVIISGGTGSQIVGNFIGPNAAGTSNIGNAEGVEITGTGATNNVVQGNLIAGNGFDGVAISGASNNRIGGTISGAGNTISSNGGGVAVSIGTGNAILGNSIFSNSGLGIDISPPGVTPNDNCESAVGPNINPQNFPVIASATADSATTTIRGTLNSAPNTQFRVELFANSECDPSGYGEGQTFLGFTNPTTDASCLFNFAFSVPNAAVKGPIITATATDPNNNTSEFSACATLVGIFPAIQFSAASYTVGEGDRHVDITVSRTTDASAAASVSFATSDRSFGQPCNVINGVASARCDYEPRMATLKFAPGETSKTIPVSIIDDSYLEGAETFSVKLSNAVGAMLGAPSTATVTIIDNDLANGPNPIDAAEVFVCMQYLDFLNREPDQSGFDFWTNQITSCGNDQACIQLKRINVSAAFLLSIESQQTGYFVERIYKTAFGDINGVSTFGGLISVPSIRLNEFLLDTQQIGEGVIVGQSGWETALENNQRAFVLDFERRPFFLIKYPTPFRPAYFVDQLFANAGVTPSTADRNAAIAEFGGATNTSDVSARARALRDVAENATLIQQEFNRAFVLMQYFAYLRRNPNDSPDSDYSGYDFWLTKLNQFNGDLQKAEMVKAFITSSEYRSRFGQP